MSTDGEADALEIEVHTNEVVAWSQLSHLRDWLPGTTAIRMLVPMEAGAGRVADTMRLCGNLFHSMTQIQVRMASAAYPVNQVIIGAAAELGHLRSLRLEGGCLLVEDIKLHVLTGLRQLESLVLLPVTGEGLNDEHMIDGLSFMTSLTCLEFRGDTDLLTDEGLGALGSLSRLRQLSILPLGFQVTQTAMCGLCEQLGELELFKAGFTASKQVDIMQGIPSRVQHMAVIVADPHAEVSSLFTTVATCLEATLSSLRITSSIKVDDAFFMVALGALTALTELRVSVAPAKPTTPPFLINMAVLAPLKHLQKLELNVVGTRAKLLLTPPLVSTMSKSFPDLTHLSLSCMVPPEPLMSHGTPTGQFRGPLQPLALSQLGSFSKLRSLCLSAPLTEAEDDESLPESTRRASMDKDQGQAPTIVVALHCLPASLESLELERALLVADPPPVEQPQQFVEGQRISDPGQQQRISDAGQRTEALAKLRALALERCEATDETLKGLFTSSPQITRLELTEVSGITGATLRALSTLSLRHLEVVDLRELGGPTRKPSVQPPPPEANSWWGWLTGTPPPQAAEVHSIPSTPRAPPPMLRHDDITALGALTTLRHLQWGVGRPLGLPPGSLFDSDGHALEDPADLSSGARMALADMRITRQALSTLTDLHEVYLDTTSRIGEAEDPYAARMISSWLNLKRASSMAGGPAPGAHALSHPTLRASSAPLEGAVPVSEGGGGPAPSWLKASVKPGCFCAGSLPVSKHDPWSGQDFWEAL